MSFYKAIQSDFKKPFIIIPTYNEKENIQQLIPEIFQFPYGFYILIIDDNSPDGTGKVADEMTKNYPNLRVLHRDKKSGLGTAYKEGFKYAINDGADLIFEMDADYSHDPKALPFFLEKIKKCDVAVGSRYYTGISVVNWPLRRLLLSLAASLYVRIILGLPIKDTTAGFKCFRSEVLKKIDLDKVRSNGYAFQIEMNYRIHREGFKIEEIPIIFIDRHTGTSKMSRKIVLEAIFIVWRLRFEDLFDMIKRLFGKEIKK